MKDLVDIKTIPEKQKNSLVFIIIPNAMPWIDFLIETWELYTKHNKKMGGRDSLI